MNGWSDAMFPGGSLTVEELERIIGHLRTSSVSFFFLVETDGAVVTFPGLHPSLRLQDFLRALADKIDESEE